VKTISLKKVSAVAVASLGFGLLSVVPAQAAALAITSTAVATSPTVATTSATPASVGTPIVATLNFVQDQIAAAATSHTIGNTYVLTNPNGTVVTASAAFTSVTGAVGGVTTTNVANVYTHTVATASTAATKAIGTISFTPTMAGVYVLTYTTVNTTLITGDTNAVQNCC
jgi:hypothetical protein